MLKTKVLVLIDWFDPAHKAGGPIRSCVNFVEQLSVSHDIYILAGAYDLGESKVLSGIDTELWTNYRGIARVRYLTKKHWGIAAFRKYIKDIDPKYIYLNGLFSFYFTIVPVFLKRMGWIPGILVLAPRGMLKSSALAFKPIKKKLFILFIRQLGLYRLVRFQATDENEKKDILKYFPSAIIQVIPNLPGTVKAAAVPLKKEPGKIDLMFTGRIHPIKNLDLLLRILVQVRGKISLTIAGNLEDVYYWRRCEALIHLLDAEKQVHFTGDLPHQSIIAALERHHLLALPTKGENFGHAIFEALSIGRPVIISDQTPWRNLMQQNAGWDLPLKQESAFATALQEAVDWDQAKFDYYCSGALSVAQVYTRESSIRQDYCNLFV